MGHVSSIAYHQVSSMPLCSGVRDFMLPSVISYFIASNPIKAPDHESDMDFQGFLRHILDNQSPDGKFQLGQSFHERVFEVLAKSLFNAMDNSLPFQPVYDAMLKSLLEHLEDSQKGNALALNVKIDRIDSEQPPKFMEACWRLLEKNWSDEMVKAIIRSMEESKDSEWYIKLLIALQPLCTRVLLSDHDNAKRLLEVMITKLGQDRESHCLALMLIDVCLQNSCIASAVATMNTSEPPVENTKTNQQINSFMKVTPIRLGENEKILSVCFLSAKPKRVLLMGERGNVYRLGASSVTPLEQVTVNIPSLLAGNRQYLFVAEESTIVIYDSKEENIAKLTEIPYRKGNNWDLIALCSEKELELFLLLRKQGTSAYRVDYLNGTSAGQVTIGSMGFKDVPVSLSIWENVLTVGAGNVAHCYEFDWSCLRLWHTLGYPLNVPKGWNLLGLFHNTVVVTKRSHGYTKLAFTSNENPLSCLPKSGSLNITWTVGSCSLNDTIKQLMYRSVNTLWLAMWFSVLQPSSDHPPAVVLYPVSNDFLSLVFNIADRVLYSPLLDNSTGSLLVFFLIGFLFYHYLDTKVLDTARMKQLLFRIVSCTHIELTNDLLLAITLFMISCKELWASDLRNIVRVIEKQHPAAFPSFCLFVPMFSTCGVFVYMISNAMMETLRQNTSEFTVLAVLKNAMWRIIEMQPAYDALSVFCNSLKLLSHKNALAISLEFLIQAQRLNLPDLMIRFFEQSSDVVAVFAKVCSERQLLTQGKNNDMIIEQVIETLHPIGNDSKYCWDIIFPGASSIEVEFDPACSIFLDDQDAFQILQGTSDSSPIVYEKKSKSETTFPRKLFIQSSSARVKFVSFAGYHLYGLRMVFRSCNSDEHQDVDMYVFGIHFFFYLLGKLSVSLMETRQTDQRFSWCSFLQTKCPAAKPEPLTCPYAISDSLMSLIDDATKGNRMSRPVQGLSNLERMCMSAVINQLSFSSWIYKMTRSVNHRPKPVLLTSPSKPKIFIPKASLLRQSLMPARKSFSLAPLVEHDGAETLINHFGRLLTQMRTRFRLAKQKSLMKGEESTYFNVVEVKAKYFASRSSIFTPALADSLDSVMSLADQLIRVLSAEFSLQDLIDYVHSRKKFDQSLDILVQTLKRMVVQIRHQELQLLVFYPLVRRLLEVQVLENRHEKPSLEAFRSFFGRISECLVKSVRMINVMSSFAMGALQETTSLDTFKGLISNHQTEIAWKFCIYFCMSASPELFEKVFQLQLESDLSGWLFVLESIFVLKSGKFSYRLGLITQSLNSGRPRVIASCLSYLAIVFNTVGCPDDVALTILSKVRNIEQLLRWFLYMVGRRTVGHEMEIVNGTPKESQLYLAKEFISFFRMCMRSGSKVSQRILQLFDNIILEQCSDLHTLIGVFAVISGGFYSSGALSGDYALRSEEKVNCGERVDKLSSPLSYPSTVCKDSMENSPPDFPMTSFRLSSICKLLEDRRDEDEYHVLVSQIVLFLAMSIQRDAKLHCRRVFDVLMSIALCETFEGQYHTMPELFHAARSFDANSPTLRDKLDHLVPLTQSAYCGNKLISTSAFYFEVTLQTTLDKEVLGLGFISDSTTTEYHECVFLSLDKKLVHVNGIPLKDANCCFKETCDTGMVVGCRYNNNSVTFHTAHWVSSEIPFHCQRYTPLLITSLKSITHSVNMCSEPFSLKMDTLESNFRESVIAVKYSKKNDQPNVIYHEIGRPYASQIRQCTRYVPTTTEFSLETPKTRRPLFACHKCTISSRVEVCSELSFAVKQPYTFKMGSKQGQVGRLIKKMGDSLILSVVDQEEGIIEEVETNTSYVSSINAHYFPKEPTYDLFRCIAIRAARRAALLLLHAFHESSTPKAVARLLSVVGPELWQQTSEANTEISACGDFRSCLISFFAHNIQNYLIPLYDCMLSVMQHLDETLISPEVLHVIETTTPMSYCRIDRKVDFGADGVLPIPVWCNLPQRGLLLQSNQKSLLIRNRETIEELLGGVVYANLANNRFSHGRGCQVLLIPLYGEAEDHRYQPISWLYRFGPFLVSLTADKVSDETVNSVINLLLSKQNQVLTLLCYEIATILLTKRKINVASNGLDACSLLYERLTSQTNIASKVSMDSCSFSIPDQKTIILLIESFVKLHYARFKEIEQLRSDPEKSNSLVSDFNGLMEASISFLESIPKTYVFVAYLLAYQNHECLFPSFLFFLHWSDRKKTIVTFSTRQCTINRSARSVWVHFSSPGSPQCTMNITCMEEERCELRITSVKDKSLHLSCRKISTLTVFCDDFDIEYVIIDSEVESFADVKEAVFTITAPKKNVSPGDKTNVLTFLDLMQLMNSKWTTKCDELLCRYVNASGPSDSELETFPELQIFPRQLIDMRLLFLKKLNELVESSLPNWSGAEKNQPLIPLLLSARTGLCSAVRKKCVENFCCRRFNQKKSFVFNRRKAELAKSDPTSPKACSLFDQMVKQIDVSSLSDLKCKVAPWQVTLEGEGSIDAGGPGRELFSQVSDEILLPHNHLFMLSPASTEGHTKQYIPDIRSDPSNRFVYVGALIALAFVTKLQQPYDFADLIWCYLADKPITLQHIYDIDPMFEKLITDDSRDMFYTIPNILGDEIELIPDGATISVESCDLERYRELAIHYRINEFNSWLRRIKEGFALFIGNICTAMINPVELKLLVCGEVDIPMSALRKLLLFVDSNNKYVGFLFDILEEFTTEERILFIKFGTGRRSLPLAEENWNVVLNVDFIQLQPQEPPYMLPIAFTCTSTIAIPSYPTKEVMAERLRTAITTTEIVLDHAIDIENVF